MKIVWSLILDLLCWKTLLSWCLKNGTSVSHKTLVSWIFWCCQMQVILSVPLTLAVAVLGLFVILIRLTSRGEEGNPLDELKLKKKKNLSKTCISGWSVPVLSTEIAKNVVFGRTAMFKQRYCIHLFEQMVEVGEMTTYAHLILQSDSEWDHRSLRASFPAAQVDITVFPSFCTWYKKSTSLLKC